MMGVCVSGLTQLFDFPAAPRTVWLSLHDRPAKCRVEMYGDFPGLSFGPSVGMWDAAEVDQLLFPLLGKKLWIECWYE